MTLRPLVAGLVLLVCPSVIDAQDAAKKKFDAQPLIDKGLDWLKPTAAAAATNPPPITHSSRLLDLVILVVLHTSQRKQQLNLSGEEKTVQKQYTRESRE